MVSASTATRRSGLFPGWAHRLAATPRLSALLGGVVSLFLLPNFSPYVGAGLDPSWATAISVASDKQLVFGRDVIFTYGPLGFLASTGFAVGYLGVLAMAARLVWTFLLTYLLVRTLQRGTDRPLTRGLAWCAGVLATFVVAGTLTPGGEAVQMPVLLVIVALVGAIQTRSRAVSWPWIFVLGLLVSTMLLTKFDTGVSTFAIVVGFLLLEAWLFRLRPGALTLRLGLLLLATTVGVLGWMITIGQPIGVVGDWLLGSWRILAGYDKAMAADYGSSMQRTIGFALAAACGALTFIAQPRGRRRFVTTVLVAGSLVLFLKQGFTRHDNGHVLRLFTAVVVLVAVGTSRTERIERIERIEATEKGLGGSAPSGDQPGDFGEASKRVARRPWRTSLLALSGVVAVAASLLAIDVQPMERPQPSTVFDFVRYATKKSERESIIARQRRLLPKELAVPAPMLRAIRKGTFTVLPAELTVAWVFPQLRWKTLPVIQAYSAYVPSLDDANAEALLAQDGPVRVLFEGGAIDGRISRWEPPRTMLSLVCNYAVTMSSQRWQLFERRDDVAEGGPDGACAGSQLDLGVVSARFGELIPIGTLPDDMVVIARFRGLETTGLKALREKITRPAQIWTGFDATSKVGNRFVVANAGQPHLLSLPTCIRDRWGSFDTRTYDQLLVSDRRDPEAASPRTFEVELTALPYVCPDLPESVTE